MSKNSKKVTPERKAALTQICDAESYLPIIRESVTEEQAAAHNPNYLANVLAGVAELYLIHYEKLGLAFGENEELVVTFNSKLSKGNADVEIAFLPVAKFKDAIKAHFDVDDQPDLGDIKNQAKGRAPKPAKAAAPRLGNAAPLNLPAPVTVEAEIVEDDDITIQTREIEASTLSDDDVKAFVNRLEDDTLETEMPDRIAAFVKDHGRDGLEKARNYAADDDGISSMVYTAIAEALEALAEPDAGDNSPEILV